MDVRTVLSTLLLQHSYCPGACADARATYRIPTEEFSSLSHRDHVEMKRRTHASITTGQLSMLCPVLKLCRSDAKRSFAELIAGKFQPLFICKRPFTICLLNLQGCLKKKKALIFATDVRQQQQQ